MSLSLLLAGCGGGGDGSQAPILGIGAGSIAVAAPTVTAVAPVNGATGVSINNPVINAVFSEAVAPLTGSASFTLTCASPCANPAGVVSLDASSRVANFTLASGSALAPLTVYTATVTGARSLATGATLIAPYVWQFTTGAASAPIAAPTVTAVAPVNGATGVSINNTVINAAFSEPVAPLTGSASFTLTCASPCTNPAGVVSLDASSRVATFTLASGSALAPLTVYTATVTGARSLATGATLIAPYAWQFTTGVAPDTTRPRVVLTVPLTSSPGPTAAVPVNTAISAAFSEDIAPATVNASSFTLSCAAPCVAPASTVSYNVGTRTAVLTPATALTPGTTYTATATTAITDLAGNALAGNQAPLPAASNYVWTFTTAAAVAAANISVQSTNPPGAATGVCPNATVNATFTIPSGLRLDPSTVNSATFTVAGPGLVPVVASSVIVDLATGRVASFTPIAPLTPGVTYTANLKSGATGIKDLAVPANTLLNDVTWTFTAGPATGSCLAPIALGTASTFGTFGGGAGITNQGLLTVINGNIGTTAVSTAVTGLHDLTPGCTYTETPLNAGAVNGSIYTAPPPPTVACPNEGTAVTLAIATQARADGLAAYNALAALPPGSDPGAGSLANLVLAPGVYTAAGGSFRIQGGPLTLDAQGNAGAVWVFQMATSLTVGGPGAAFPQSVVLVNGAQAKNVYWQVGSAATINAAGGGTMVGTIISQAGASFSTPGNVNVLVLNGRVLSLGASVTLVNTVINVPGP